VLERTKDSHVRSKSSRRLHSSAPPNGMHRLFGKVLTAKWGEKPLCPGGSCKLPPGSESRVHTIQPHAMRKKRNKRKKII
jgi:hypothetical protein